MATAIPAAGSAILSGITKAGVAAGSQLPGAATYQQEDKTQQLGTASAGGALSEQQVQALPSTAEGAKAGVEAAAEKTKEIATPAAAGAVAQSQQATKSAQDIYRLSQQQYREAINNTNDLTIEAGRALESAANAAKINPERYKESLGVGGKTLAAIGMVLSGIGAGLTGQPNMAMDVFQRNIDRDIQAQKNNYQNLMEQAAQKQGLLRTAMDRQVIAANAAYAAQMSVLQGAKSAIESAAAQSKFAAAPDAAKSLLFTVDQQLLQTTDSHNQFYQTMSNSGNLNWQNLLGVAATEVTQKASGYDLRLNRESPRERAASGQVKKPMVGDFWQNLQIMKEREAQSKPKSEPNFLVPKEILDQSK